LPQVVYFDLVLEMMPIVQKIYETYLSEVGERHSLTVAAKERLEMLTDLINSSGYMRSKQDLMTSTGGFWSAARRKSRKMSTAAAFRMPDAAPSPIVSSLEDEQRSLQPPPPIVRVYEGVDRETTEVQIRHEPMIEVEQPPPVFEVTPIPNIVQDHPTISQVAPPKISQEVTNLEQEKDETTLMRGHEEVEFEDVHDHFTLMKSIGSMQKISSPQSPSDKPPNSKKPPNAAASPEKSRNRKLSSAALSLRKEATLQEAYHTRTPSSNRPRGKSISTKPAPAAVKPPKTATGDQQERLKKLVTSSPYGGTK
jgi:hypothetical protein